MAQPAHHIHHLRTGSVREAVITAFAQLVLTRRYADIRVGELIARAGVARSTFYEHFGRKDDVLLASVDRILQPLCETACGNADPARLCAMLRHMWERRALGRTLLTSGTGPLLQRYLSDMIMPRLSADRFVPAERALLSRATSAGQLTMIRMWLSGEVSCSVEQLAGYLSAHVVKRDNPV